MTEPYPEVENSEETNISILLRKITTLKLKGRTYKIDYMHIQKTEQETANKLGCVP